MYSASGTHLLARTVKMSDVSVTYSPVETFPPGKLSQFLMLTVEKYLLAVFLEYLSQQTELDRPLDPNVSDSAPKTCGGGLKPD